MPRILTLLTLIAVGSPLVAQDEVKSAAPPKAKLASIGPIAFADDHTLLVSDPKGAAIYAFAVADEKAQGLDAKTDIQGFDGKIAALLGIEARDLQIVDVAVNPLTQQAYVAVMRGQGNAAQPVLVKVSAKDELAIVDLADRKFSMARLTNVPAAQPQRAGGGGFGGRGNRRGRQRGSRRLESITDLAWVRGKVVVAGLSNEEFASKLRVLDYPLESADQGTSVEIYHGAHGKFETRSPIRTFVPYLFEGEQHIVAAYTCTPLVIFPMPALSPGKKVQGRTVAELGNRNRPLDIIVYEDEGEDFLLMANSSRGVMKVPTAGMQKQEGLSSRVPRGETAGQKYETIKSWQGVMQLDKLDRKHALILVQGDGGFTLKAVPLP